MNNQSFNQQNDENLPKAQDVKKANKSEFIIWLLAVIFCILGGTLLKLVGIGLCIYLFVKKFRKPKN